MTTTMQMTFTGAIYSVLRCSFPEAASSSSTLATSPASSSDRFASRVSRLEPGWLPGPVLEALEAELELRVHPAVYAGAHPSRVGALFARFILPPVQTRFGWEIPDELAADVGARLRAFSLPPSALIDGAQELVALWRLDRALDYQDALALQERLASALGASTEPVRYIGPRLCSVHDVELVDAHDPRLPIPLAGPVRGWDGRAPLTEIIVCDPTRTYPLEEIERAITGGTE